MNILLMRHSSGCIFTPVLKGADTKVVHTHSLIVGAVADHIPLKQGLRLHHVSCFNAHVVVVADHIPFIRGLRLFTLM